MPTDCPVPSELSTSALIVTTVGGAERHGLTPADISFVGHQASEVLNAKWSKALQPKTFVETLKKYANNLDGEQLLAAVIMSSVLGVTVFLVFGWIQNLAIGKWHGDRA